MKNKQNLDLKSSIFIIFFNKKGLRAKSGRYLLSAYFLLMCIMQYLEFFFLKK